jgi:AcrR family transcriptional regulator
VPRISEEQREATRRRLIDAAISVTLTKGNGSPTTREILAEAGLSAGALYHYFESKDELSEAIAQQFVDQDWANQVLPDDACAKDAIEHHSAVVHELFAEHHHAILARLRASSLENEPVRATMGHLDEKVVEHAALTNGRTQQLGLFVDDIDPAVLAELILIFWEGLIMRDSVGSIATDRQKVVDQFVDLLVRRVIDPDQPDADLFIRRLTEAARR